MSHPESEITAPQRRSDKIMTFKEKNEAGLDNRCSNESIGDRNTEKNQKYADTKIGEGHLGKLKPKKYWIAFNYC